MPSVRTNALEKHRGRDERQGWTPTLTALGKTTAYGATSVKGKHESWSLSFPTIFNEDKTSETVVFIGFFFLEKK